MADVVCPKCRHPNGVGSNFCSSCGQALDGPPEHGTTAIYDLGVDEAEAEAAEEPPPEVPAGTGVLVVKRGPKQGSRFALDADVTQAGRHPDSDIFLDDITVSRRHAEIVRTGAGYEVSDVGSLNGTYVNRERIEAPTPLGSGDELQVGKFKLVFYS